MNKYIFAALIVIGIFLPFFDVHAQTDVTAEIFTDTIWTLADSPYVVSGTIGIYNGATLTIEPGVIVKFTNDGQLYVIGSLIVNGTAQNKVYFTSIKDDSVGGDTNNDGNGTLPAMGDWYRVFAVTGARINFDNAVIRYGGNWFANNGPVEDIRAVVLNSGGVVNIRNSEISNNFTGFQHQGISGGTFNISTSTIINNQLGIYVYAWANGSGVITSSDISENAVYAIENHGVFVLDAKNNWWGDVTGPHDLIGNSTGLGSGVYGNVDYTPWLQSAPTTQSLEPVIIIPGILGSAEKDGQMLIDPILHVYDDFIATFEANGYEKDKTIFTFPYNWRNSNINSAQSLRLKINQVKQVCECDKVNVVAHSMGGLVLRQYMESPAYQNDVDKIVFIGTPHLGSPEDYLAWEGASSGPFDLVNIAMFRMIEQEGKHFGYANLFDYIHNRPIESLKELLPIYPYKIDISNHPGPLEEYSSQNYPQNVFLENLELNKNVLGSNLTLNIVGDNGISTVSSIVTKSSTSLPLWQHGEPVNLSNNSGLVYSTGDGSVPIESSMAIQSSQLIKLNHKHTDLVDYSSGNAFRFFNGNDAQTIIINQNNPAKKYVFIRLFSPIDMVVIAPNGKRVGKDFVTGQEINEIPGAFYSGFDTDDEYVTIPDPIEGEYKVETIGTDNGGEYTIVASNISENGASDSSFTGQTLLGLQTSVSFSINSATTTLEITPDDKISPIVTITSPLAGDYDHAQIITVSATYTDNIGVSTTTLSFANRLVTNPTNIDLFFEKLGTTTILATATDFQNNLATSSLDIRIVATASSTVFDINRAYSLGLITKKSIKDELIQKLQKVLKAQKRIENIIEKVNSRNTIRKIERIEMVIDKTLGRALLLDLKGYTKDKINEKGYNLIKEDLEWLISN